MKLCRRLNRFEKVKMIEVTSERVCYTKHGQHLNAGGKEIMAKKIVAIIESVLNRRVEPLGMKWCHVEVSKNTKPRMERQRAA